MSRNGIIKVYVFNFGHVYCIADSDAAYQTEDEDGDFSQHSQLPDWD